MKRSEMVKQIEHFLRTYKKEPGLFGRKNDLASDLLAYIENMGMQPPNITKCPDEWFRSTGDYGYEAAEWEEEKNEKD